MMIPHRWTRPEAIDVCLEALATGRVHGVSPNHDPDLLAWNSTFAQNGLGPHAMVRDWGLFEAHFVDRRCEFFMVQAHRMKKPPKWKRLLPHLEQYGLAPGAFTAPDHEYHRVVASDSEVCVDSTTGRVMKITVPATPPLPRTGAPLPRNLPRDIRAVATGPRSAWDRWLDRRPVTDWPSYPGLLSNLHRDHPAQRETWTAFGLWLLDRARAVWPADEWAWRWSRFVLDRPGTVPAGTVAPVCLAALPLTRAEAAELPRDWRGRTPSEIRNSRMTLALLRNAALDVPAPPVDPELAAWRPLMRGVG
ncbi:hypothetical protein [Actinoplanes couchii]|nr:hypothetical protein [Actinoplanes couchii]MDR6320788.1 hypothetical protein [Actinoplanes couchii]